MTFVRPFQPFRGDKSDYVRPINKL